MRSNQPITRRGSIPLSVPYVGPLVSDWAGDIRAAGGIRRVDQYLIADLLDGGKYTDGQRLMSRIADLCIHSPTEDGAFSFGNAFNAYVAARREQKALALDDLIEAETDAQAVADKRSMFAIVRRCPETMKQAARDLRTHARNALKLSRAMLAEAHRLTGRVS